MSAVKLYLSNDKSIDVIAQDLGVSRATLGHWVRQYKEEGDKSFPGSGHSRDEEIKSLKRQLYLVQQERDILKKAIAIQQRYQFMKDHKDFFAVDQMASILGVSKSGAITITETVLQA